MAAREKKGGGERRRASSQSQPRRTRPLLVSGGDPSPLEIGVLRRPSDPDVSLDEDDLLEDELDLDPKGLL
jgi:hypothetical protein